MTKREYLAALEARLGQLPAQELATQLSYYEELLDDMTEDGMTEAQAAEKLGPPEALAADILCQQPLPALVRSRMRPKKGWSALSVTLLIAGSPVWLPVGLALCAVALSVYAVLWSVLLALFAADLALWVCVPALLLCWVMNLVRPVPALMLLGGCLACAGLALGLLVGALAAARGTVKLTAAIGRGIKGLFIRKESV